MLNTSQILKIHIPKDPAGYKIITLDNFNLKCFLIPRSELKEVQQRDESKLPALYFLFGKNEEGLDSLYIGESESFLKRLMQHNDTKLFWNKAVVFTGNLDKSKIKYLEYISIQEAQNAKRLNILNKTEASENTMSEEDLVSTKNYFNQVKYILSSFDYQIFDKIEDTIDKTDSNVKIYLKESKGNAWNAIGIFIQGEDKVKILKGSLARLESLDSFKSHPYYPKRLNLIDKGVLKITDDSKNYIFTEDYICDSTSEAGSYIKGSSVNGWKEWKNEDGKTLDEMFRI